MLEGKSKSACSTFCLIGDMAHNASLMWFIVLIWDLRNAMRNPFSVHKDFYTSYFLFVSVATAAMVLCARIAGISWYCDSNWCFDEANASTSPLQTSILILSPSITILVVLFSVFMWLRVRRLLQSGNALSSPSRINILRQGNSLVGVVGACYMLNSIKFILEELLNAFFMGSNLNQHSSFYYAELFFFLFMVFGDVYALLRNAHFSSQIRHAFSLHHAHLSPSINRSSELSNSFVNDPLPNEQSRLLQPTATYGGTDLNRDRSFSFASDFRPEVASNSWKNHEQSKGASICNEVEGYGNDSKDESFIMISPSAHQGSAKDYYISQVLQEDIMLFISFGVIRTVRSPNATEYVVNLPPKYGRSFGFIDVLPQEFADLRQHYGIDPIIYAASFVFPDQGTHLLSAMMGSFSEGRSGSFMYFTKDRKYVVKTVTSRELEVLKALIPQYATYIRRNPNSLLIRFYGVHGVRLSSEQRMLYFVIMERVGGACEDVPINLQFDLKGSTVQRGSRDRSGSILASYLNSDDNHLSSNNDKNDFAECMGGEKLTLANTYGSQSERPNTCNTTPHQDLNGSLMPSSPNMLTSPARMNSPLTRTVSASYVNPRSVMGNRKLATQKDNDLAAVNGKFYVGDRLQQSILYNLKCDADFLLSQGVMDYSLLVCVHQCSRMRITCPARLQCPFGGGHECPAGILCTVQAGKEKSMQELQAEGVRCPAGEMCAAVRNGMCDAGERCSSRFSCSRNAACPAGLACPKMHACADGDSCLLTRNWDSCPAESCPRSQCSHHPRTPVTTVAPDQLRDGFPGIFGSPCIYYFNIIDIFQLYDWSKSLEHHLKTKILRHDPSEISCVQPDVYASRFSQRIAAYLE